MDILLLGTVLLSGLLGGMIVMLLFGDFIARKFVASMRISQTQIQSDLNEEVSDHHNKLEESNQKSLEVQQEMIDAQQTKAREEFKKIAEHFRASLNEDPTTKVLAAAYQVVALGSAPRHMADSELAEAVVAHEKTGPEDLPKVDLPPGTLN